MTHCLLRRPNLSSSPQIHLPPFSNKKLQKIESFYLGNTLGNYKSNLNKIDEVTIISILRFTWNSSLLSFFNSTRIILRHVAKSHFFTFFKGLQKCSALYVVEFFMEEIRSEKYNWDFYTKETYFFVGIFSNILCEKTLLSVPFSFSFPNKTLRRQRAKPEPQNFDVARHALLCMRGPRVENTLESFSDKLIFHLNVK